MLEASDKGFILDVACGKGVYVRTLVSDLARAMGGRAHVVDLIRTAQGPLDQTQCEDLETLTAEKVLELCKQTPSTTTS